MEAESGIPIKKLVFGLCLVVIGVAAFLGSIDVWNVRHIGRFWPLILIALGLSGEIEAIQRRKGDGSYVLLAIGCWMLVGNFGLFGLSISRAMPVGILVAGLALVLHAIIDRPVNPQEEKDNVC